MKKLAIILTLLFSMGIVFSGCREDKTAGEKMEEGIEKIKEGAEDVGDEIEDGIDEMEDEIDDSVDD